MNSIVLSNSRHAIFIACLEQQAPIARSEHFTLYRLDMADQAPDGTIDLTNIVVVHTFAPEEIDNNVGYYVANELLPLLHATARQQTAYSEQELFECYVGAIVRSVDGDERRAWQLFYDNTLHALGCAASSAAARVVGGGSVGAPGVGSPNGFIANFGAIYQQSLELIAECVGGGPAVRSGLHGTPGPTLLDVATCFGFFPLFLSNQALGPSHLPPEMQASVARLEKIVGCDLNPALVTLANQYTRQQRSRAEFVWADILTNDSATLRAHLQGAAFTVVTALHLLEHLEAAETKRALANLWMLTERRLIIAVPLEDVPDRRFGHVQTFTRERLLEIGQHLGGEYRYFEYCGGWLVIDRADYGRYRDYTGRAGAQILAARQQHVLVSANARG